MKGRSQKLRLCLLIAGVLLSVLIVLCIGVPMTKLLLREDGRAELAARVEACGVFAPVVFVLLMAVQIVIAFIPGGPMELMGGMLFGGALGLLYTVLGCLLGTCTVYGLVRWFGKPLVQIFVPEERLQTLHFLQNEKRLSFWVFVLFLVPGIPKDMLTYIVPLTPLRGRQFLCLSAIARFPALAASVFLGDSLMDGHYRLCVMICLVAAIGAFAGLQLYHYLIERQA